MSDFRDIIDTEGLNPDEEARLRRVHELLVRAGPPPDLPPSLERTPEAEDGPRVATVEILERRAVARCRALNEVAVTGHPRHGTK